MPIRLTGQQFEHAHLEHTRCKNLIGCYPHDIGGYLHSLYGERRWCDMSPYEILIVVFTVIAIIVGILIEYIKK